MIVKLNIRTQSLSGQDVELECQLDWSILKLKQEIEKVIEGHPRPDDQRLVYAGKLLENYSQLQHVLRMEDNIDSHTVHLVCRQLQSPPTDHLRQRKIPQQPQPHLPEVVESRPPPLQAQPPYQDFDIQAWTEALRQHQSQFSLPPGQQSHDQQHYWLQQMYSQYMTQYMQYLHTTGAVPPATFNPTSAESFFPPPAANPNNNNVVGNAQPAPNAGQNQPNVILNAGAGGGALGAMEDDEELGGQRDVLDWFYVASRVIILLSIVYFYSSLARFALVTFMGLAVYLWNVGFFQRRNRQPEPAQANADNANDQEIIRREVDQVRQAATGEANREETREDTQNEQDNGSPDDIEDQNQTTEDVDSMQVQEEATVEQNNPLATTFTFITTFFSSLLPEQPQVV